MRPALLDAGMALPHPRLIAAGVALVLAFGAGWAAQGWRMGAEYTALEMRYATRLAQAHENALTEYARLEKVKNDAVKAAEIEAEKNAAAAAAKSLQSCPTLWDSIEGSPPGSAVPGILQARTLECVAISFCNA